MAPGRAKSVPSAKPEKAHTTRNSGASPGPSHRAPVKAAIATNMPNIQLRASPQCRTSRSHSGIDMAALAK